MTDRILLGIASLSALVCVAGVLRCISFRARKYCPGPRLSLREWLFPFNWLSSIGCGYDLTGHLQNSRNVLPIRCSECGRVITRHRQMRRRPRRWRMVTAGGFFTVILLGTVVQRFFAQTHWDDDLPTWALIRIEQWCGESTPIGVRKELRKRIYDFDDGQLADLMPMLVNDLHSDHISWNAANAAYALRKQNSTSARRMLREALRSADWQQRQVAAYVLRDLDDSPSLDLMRVSIEALRYGDADAEGAFGYILNHGDAWRELLHEELDSDCAQQQQLAARILCALNTPPTERLLEALIVGFTRRGARYEWEVCRILFDRGFRSLVDFFGRHAPARQFLRRCLREQTGTARHLAACMLREAENEIDANILAGLIDGLQFDRWPESLYIPSPRDFIVRDSITRIVETGTFACDELARGMEGYDPQQRLLCAAIAGFAGMSELAPQAAPILLEHLQNNFVEHDAVFAVVGFVGFGEAVLPDLEAAVGNVDEQADVVVTYILQRIRGEDVRLPTRINQWGSEEAWLTGVTHDPIRLEWWRLDVPRVDPIQFTPR